MGGKVPAEDMTRDRLAIMAELEETVESTKDDHARLLLKRLYGYLETCPRTSCAYCEHQARSEAQRQSVQNPE